MSADRRSSVTDKLDPRLSELVESAESGSGDRSASVDVLVAIDTEIDEVVRDALTARGLTVRSEMGTILTGSIRLGDVPLLAESSNVIKLEAGTTLFPEPTEDGGVENI
jgi:hypothetical protein